MTCPTEIHKALAEILYCTMVEVRANNSDCEYCFALADHAHNIPRLMNQYKPELFFYYWECERECFIGALERQGKEPLSRFVAEWNILEPLYESIRATHHVFPAIVLELESGVAEVVIDQDHLEKLLSPGRGIQEFRILDCEGTDRQFTRRDDGTYRCKVFPAKPSEIRSKLLMFGASIEKFDPTDLLKSKYPREMFDAYIQQLGESDS